MLDLYLASSEGRDREGPLQFLDQAMWVRTLFQEDTVELGEGEDRHSMRGVLRILQRKECKVCMVRSVMVSDDIWE